MFPPLHGGNMMFLSLFKSCPQSAYVRASADFPIFRRQHEVSAARSYGSIIPAIDTNMKGIVLSLSNPERNSPFTFTQGVFS
jgi:hypothetical protein